MKRYVVEGTWSGYRSEQRRVAHRTVMRYAPKVQTIQYTDGTTLDIAVRQTKKYERVKQIHGYDDLIRQADSLNKPWVTVDELIAKRTPEAR